MILAHPPAAGRGRQQRTARRPQIQAARSRPARRHTARQPPARGARVGTTGTTGYQDLRDDTVRRVVLLLVTTLAGWRCGDGLPPRRHADT